MTPVGRLTQQYDYPAQAKSLALLDYRGTPHGFEVMCCLDSKPLLSNQGHILG
jgi:hypothetical protein